MNMDFILCFMQCLIDHWPFGIVIAGFSAIGAYHVGKITYIIGKAVVDVFRDMA